MEIIFYTMDDGKADQPAPIISPPHSRNDANTSPTESTPMSISTAVLARQVKVIDDSVDIPIIFRFHKKVLLEKCLR